MHNLENRSKHLEYSFTDTTGDLFCAESQTVTADASFILEEVRDGYVVTSHMKGVYLHEINLLKEFIRICEKYQLKWTMIGGSLLGAVRHKGFIPWDDDIDVAMLREDYDCFLKIAENELQHPYFLQTSLTDPGRCIGYAQIRNSETSAIDLRYINDNIRYNQGIFIDIFPLDGISGKEAVRQKQRKQINTFLRIYRNAFRTVSQDASEVVKHLVSSLLVKIIGLDTLFQYHENIFRQVPVAESEQVGLISFLFDESRFQWNKTLFDELEDAPFEFLTVKIPKTYDEILSASYGDWKCFIRNGSMHSGIDFSCTMPYKDYLKEKYGHTW